MDIDEQIIARDRADLAQAEYDQAHLAEILAEMEKKYPKPPIVPWWVYLVMATVLAFLAWWWFPLKS